MALDDTLALPFFDDDHRRFAGVIAHWADTKLRTLPHDDVDAACRARVKALGEAGLLKAAVPPADGSRPTMLDVRTLCIAREVLAFRDGLADFAFAMQGLGTGSIVLFGTDDAEAALSAAGARGQRHRSLRAERAGSRLRRLGACHDRQGRRCICPARRRENLDIERRNRRPLRGVCAKRRGARRQGAHRLSGRCRYAGAQRSPNASR